MTCEIKHWCECQLNPGNHHGTCHDYVASYSCSCKSGWTSQGCDVNIDECASSPCVRGSSLDGIDAFMYFWVCHLH